jgi:succinyldiaminopimelate transaminase
LIDCSVGTPVDPTPDVVVAALDGQAPGYPFTAGTPKLREACAGWLARRHGVTISADAVLPVIGTKEFIAALPTLLDFSAANSVSVPPIAYPTYAVGALVAGSRICYDDFDADLVWVNSPSNPTGAVRTDWSDLRNRPGIITSDECYLEFGWEAEPISMLHPDACAGSHTGLLAVHSLSKRSNMAGYRFGFVAGDPDLIARLLEVRKHMGAMVPTPVQTAAIAAWNDDVHVDVQRERYARRRLTMRNALLEAGFRIDHSEAGLYLWATRDEPCWETVEWCAERGLLVTPGDFYGPAGERHVRVAMTATDADIATAAARLAVA